MPLKVLPDAEFQSGFIGYLTRPLGFFFVSVDTEKSSKAPSEAVPRRAGQILGSYLRKVLRHSEINLRLRHSENILSSAFSAVGIAHLFESPDDLYIFFILSSRWE